ncbi:hypothetical protein MRB53_018406 [Persea americana]|uniref:Uncharacterized protein n=1 Tax=Persea americana TaxID=3435 RepID=A0ACC2M7B1_PERAE|nr:hypothetical protein MRB53_018406 [Persea americana]
MSWFLVFFLSLFLIATAQPKQFGISLNSFLTPTSNPPSWRSPSGRYAFGFYPQGNGFAVGVWLAGPSNKTFVVWTANRDGPLVPADAILVLPSNGRLLLRSRGRDTPISDVGVGASSASMLDTGNFVLYDAFSEIIWQTFNSPTDTLLVGQSLLTSGELFSSASETNHSAGRFRLKMQSDGNLVIYPINTWDMPEVAIWNTATNTLGNDILLNLNNNGLSLVKRSGSSVHNLTEGLNPPNKTTAVIIYRAVLDFGGIFRLYSHHFENNGSSSMTEEWPKTFVHCDVKGFCGINSYCIQNDTGADCRCPRGFDFLDPVQKFQGCMKKFIEEGCAGKRQNKTYYIDSMKNTVWEDDPYSILFGTNEQECREACLQDCNCEAASFKDSVCRKQKLPLRYWRRSLDGSATSLIKFSNGTWASTDGFSKTSEKGLSPRIMIIIIALMGCSFVIIVVSGFLIHRHQIWRMQRYMSSEHVFSSTQALMAIILISLLFISVFSISTTQPQQFNITLNSSLTPTNNTAWLSPSGRFSFGFYPQGNGFAVGVWLAGSSENRIVVWTANRDNQPVSDDAILLLTREGSLLLRSRGQDTLISNARAAASSASMLDTGNFVLYTSRFQIIWQTFDSPTDTLLAGQSLLTGRELFSGATGTNHSTGRFRLKMQTDGNLVLYPVNTMDIAVESIWSTATQTQGNNVTLHLNNNGQIFMLNSSGYYIKNITDSLSSINQAATVIIYRAILDFGGFFRLYSHSFDRNGNSTMIEEWPKTSRYCEVKGFCGINSYCTQNDSQADCSCPRGFDFVDPGKRFQGCVKNFIEEGCRGKKENMTYDIDSIKNTLWENNPYSSPIVASEQECRDACLQDCNCEAAFFKERVCQKQKLPLRYGKRNLDDSTTSLIKFGIGNWASPDDKPKPMPPTQDSGSEKEQNKEIFVTELLDELPGKRKHEEASDVSDDSSLDDEDGLEVFSWAIGDDDSQDICWNIVVP